MQAIDKRAIGQFGIPGLVLMENAGRSAVNALQTKFADLQSQRVVIFAGKGNNGGDGFVMARHLAHLDVNVEVFLTGKRADLKNEAKINAGIAHSLGIPIHEVDADNLKSFDHKLRHADLIVDAVFGTGLAKPASGFYEPLFDAINALDKFVVSVDIPSGLDSDTGQAIGPHVQADLTLALALAKRSHLLYPAVESMGEVWVLDIGIPQQAVEAERVSVEAASEPDIAEWFAKRPRDAHKGHFGHVLTIAGSPGKAGAGGLAALAALRAGCGLSTLALPEGCQKAVEFNPLETMSVALPETASGALGLQARAGLVEQLADKSAVALGPGLGTDAETAALLRELLPIIEAPLVIDADGLNCLGMDKSLLSLLKPDTILTPHPKEMSRLTGKSTEAIQKNRIEAAAEFAAAHSVCLILKGAGTVLAFPDGSVCLNTTGNPGMATAGSGDVLTGILAGLLAQGFDVKQAAIAGVHLHGLAGDLYAEENTETSLISGDLLDCLPAALKQVLG